LVEAVHFPPV